MIAGPGLTNEARSSNSDSSSGYYDDYGYVDCNGSDSITSNGTYIVDDPNC